MSYLFYSGDDDFEYSSFIVGTNGVHVLSIPRSSNEYGIDVAIGMKRGSLSIVL
jgi:hypothetical protein